MFKPISPPPVTRLSDVIARQLEHMIVEGRLMPGDALPSERDLARQIGVSRPSLREALSELRSRGLIEPARNGGAVVKELTRATLTDPLSRMLERHPSTMRDLIEMRFVLEAHAAVLAATRATPADLAKLKVAIEAQVECRSRNAAILAKRDLDFHGTVAQASHNIALLHTAHGLSRLIRTFVRRGYELILASEKAREGKAAVEREHLAIYEAICRQDPEGARLAAHAHLRSTEQIWTIGPDAATLGSPPAAT